MHRQIETADFNISSEKNLIIMSEEDRLKKENKTRALFGDKSQEVKQLQQRLT